MSDRVDPRESSANIGNPNRGSPGTNTSYDQAQGNQAQGHRGKQKNLKWNSFSSRKKGGRGSG